MHVARASVTTAFLALSALAGCGAPSVAQLGEPAVEEPRDDGGTKPNPEYARGAHPAYAMGPWAGQPAPLLLEVDGSGSSWRTAGQWKADGMTITFAPDYGKATRRYELVAGCGIVFGPPEEHADSEVYYQGRAPADCPIAAAPLTRLEQCLVGGIIDGRTTYTLYANRVLTRDFGWGEVEVGVWSANAGGVTFSRYNRHVDVGMESVTDTRLSLQRTGNKVCLDGRCIEMRDDCRALFMDTLLPVL